MDANYREVIPMKINFKQVPLVQDALESFKVGQEEYIMMSDIKPSTLRTTSRKILKMKFEVSEAGLTDRTYVKRLK